SPCLSGSRRSMTPASNPAACNISSAVCASLACSGRKPLCASARCSQAAISNSSSTSSMRIGPSIRDAELLAPLDALAQVTVVAPAPEQDAGKLIQSLSVDVALELDDRIERNPVLAPPPSVELRRVGRAQADI